jgi:hypothetical protein
MSARELPSTDATAFRLAAMLEQYEQDVEELTSTWLDTVLYARISADLREMRLLCAGCPALSVPWVHLLIAHAELMHCMWAARPDGGEQPTAERCKAAHLLATRALRQQCLRHFTGTERMH